MTDNTKTTSNLDATVYAQMAKAAPTYDRYMKWITLGRERILREKTILAAGVRAGDTILEVGCGTGTLTLEARRHAGPRGSAFGIDVIPLMVDLSRQKAARAGSDVTFQVGSMAEIPFPDNRFDLVIGSFMIFHMSDATRSKGLAEVRRVLKPGGRLFILDLALPVQPFQRVIAQRILGYAQEDELTALLPVLEAHGFTGIERGVLGFSVYGLSLLGTVSALAQK